MSREPTTFYLLRLLCVGGICAFMGMLYWSNLLIEEDLKSIKMQLARPQAFQPAAVPVAAGLQPSPPSRSQSQIDPSLPNLLTEDRFYTTALPKLLGSNFQPLGNLSSATISKPDNLQPFSEWFDVISWQGLCTIGLANSHVGVSERMAPALALKIEERPQTAGKGTEFWVHLRDDVYWQPLQASFFSEAINLAPQFLQAQPVTAHDIVFFCDALLNPYVEEGGVLALRSYYGDLESVTALDDWTLVVRWKNYPITADDGITRYLPKYQAASLTGALRPLAGFAYKYFSDGSKIVEDDHAANTYRTSSLWAHNFATHWARNIIISCGPWAFAGMTDHEIRFARIPHFYDPYGALTAEQTVQFKPTTEAIWQQFKNNQLDSYPLLPNQLSELEDFLASPQYLQQKQTPGNAIQRLNYLNLSYSYVGWNNANPLFSSKRVRQALTMAIDRQRIIAQNLNHMAVEISCPFAPTSKAYDPNLKPWPFDLLQARRLLAEEGWYDSDGDGILDKEIDGKRVPFRFRLTYYVKNEISKAIGEYIATALKELSITCDLQGVDIADLSSIFDDKSFEALMLAWSMGSPPEDPKQLWHSSEAKLKGSSNAIGFANKDADALIDALQYEADPMKRQQLYRRFDAIIHEEAPYTFLYAPKTTLLYRDRVQNVFIPTDRPDLIPDADIAQPSSSLYWLKT